MPFPWNSRIAQFIPSALLGSALLFGLITLGPFTRSPIQISSQKIEILRQDYFKRTGNWPKAGQLQELVQQAVDEEILAREAVRLNLRLDEDPAVKRLLSEKMRILLSKGSRSERFSDADLLACLERHRKGFQSEESISFTHVYFRPGNEAAARARQAKSTLEARKVQRFPSAAAARLSDPFNGGLHFKGMPRTLLERRFGQAFTRTLFSSTEGVWLGPFRSSFGTHLIRVHERIPGKLPPLQTVRTEVAALLAQERSRERLTMGLHRLRGLYRVQVPPPEEPAPKTSSRQIARGGWSN